MDVANRARIPWLLAALALAGLSMLAAALMRAARPEPARRPDVVIVALDTLRPDHLGTYGYGRDTSPVIDAFAEGAVVFEAAESVAPWTAPALISLMTSLHPEVHGVNQYPNPGRMSGRVTTLAERLKAAGYATGAFTEGGYAKGAFGLDQGFDVYPSNPGDEDGNASNVHHGSRLEGNLDRALAWYREQAGRPRLLFFHTYEVHAPLRAPDEYVQRFRPGWNAAAEDARIAAALERFEREREIAPEDVQLLFDHRHHCIHPEGLALPAGLQSHLNASGLNPEGGALNPATLAFYRDLYDAEIRYTDAQLARLFEAVPDDTVVVLVSDHGEAIGEHGKIGHGSRFHREQLGIVLIVRAPAALAPHPTVGRVRAPVRSIDVKPTVLELVGLDPNDGPMQGASLVPLMRGAGAEADRRSFSHGLGIHGEELARRSLRVGDTRAILETTTGTVRLYDLAADPAELRDLAPEHPELARELGEAIRRQIELDAALARVASGAIEEVQLDEELLRDLERLGYLSGE